RSVTQRLVQAGGKPCAGNESRAAQADVEIAQHTPLRERARPRLKHIEPVGRQRPANHGADRCAADDVGLKPLGGECADNPDMGEAACSAPAECQTYGGAAPYGGGINVGVFGTVLDSPIRPKELKQRPSSALFRDSPALAWRH